jgi:hypothetical protein
MAGPQVPPRSLGPDVGTAQLITDIRSDPQLRPSLPPELRVRGAHYWALYKICVDSAGDVSTVTPIRKPDDDAVDHRWQAMIHHWRYRPYTIDGRPVPFCHPMRVDIQEQ